MGKALRVGASCRVALPRLKRGARHAAGTSGHSVRDAALQGDFEFAICGNFMPSSAREGFFVLRALNVEIAGARDAARGNVLATRLRLQFFRDLIGAAYTGANHAHPLYQPLATAVRQHGLTRRWLERLVDARAEALDGPPPVSVSDLEAYADQTASSLLLLSLESCGVRDDRADEAASLIGRAAGISTVLRALPARLVTRAAAAAGLERTTPGYASEHHGLPREELGRVGLSDRDLASLGLRLLTEQKPEADAARGSSSERGEGDGQALCSEHAAERKAVGTGKAAEVRWRMGLGETQMARSCSELPWCSKRRGPRGAATTQRVRPSRMLLCGLFHGAAQAGFGWLPPPQQLLRLQLLVPARLPRFRLCLSSRLCLMFRSLLLTLTRAWRSFRRFNHRTQRKRVDVLHALPKSSPLVRFPRVVAVLTILEVARIQSSIRQCGSGECHDQPGWASHGGTAGHITDKPCPDPRSCTQAPCTS